MLRVVVLSLLLATTVARADDLATYEASGDASSVGSDGRVAALDDAFARAVGQALEDLLPADIRTSRKADLDREIVGHARLWIAKFTVTKDETNDQRRQLTVAVRVDREKMRARLTELNVLSPDPTAPKAQAVVVVVEVKSPAGMRFNYGVEATKALPGAAVAIGLFRAAGRVVKPAPTGVKIASAALDEAYAMDLAAYASVEQVARVFVTVEEAVAVRGLAQPQVLVTASVTLLARTGAKQLATGAASTVVADGAEVGLAHAIDRAVTSAMGDVLPPQPVAIAKVTGFHGDDTPLAEPGVVLVRMSAKTPYALVLAEQKHLQGAKGVNRATLRRIGPSGWVIGVTTNEPADRIASIARKAPATATTASAKLAGDIVELALVGAP